MPSFERATHISVAVIMFALLAPPGVHGGQRRDGGAGPTQLSAARLPDGTPPPTLDGTITEDAWLTVAPFATFTQTDPIEGELILA